MISYALAVCHYMIIAFNHLPIFGNVGHFIDLNILTHKFLCPEQQNEIKSLSILFYKMEIQYPSSRLG